jgi:hypothetical protein
MCRHLNKVVNDWVDDYRARARRDDGDGGYPSAPQFSELEPFAKSWCLPASPSATPSAWPAPWTRCRRSTDALFPRAEEAIAYCDKFPLDDLPDDVQRLLQLLYSLIMVSFPVEIWRQPYIPDTGTASFELKLEPTP